MRRVVALARAPAVWRLPPPRLQAVNVRVRGLAALPPLPPLPPNEPRQGQEHEDSKVNVAPAQAQAQAQAQAPAAADVDWEWIPPGFKRQDFVDLDENGGPQVLTRFSEKGPVYTFKGDKIDSEFGDDAKEAATQVVGPSAGASEEEDEEEDEQEEEEDDDDDDEDLGEMLASSADDEYRRSRRQRVEEWSLQAEQLLDRNTSSIKVIRGKRFSMEEVRTVLEMNRGIDVMAFPSESSGMQSDIVVASAGSAAHLNALQAILRKALRARRLKTTLQHVPAEVWDDWVCVDLGNMTVHLFSEARRKEIKMEEKLMPDVRDSLLDPDVQALLDSEDLRSARTWEGIAKM